MASALSSVLRWETMEQRKHKGQNLYYDLFRWKLLQLPPDVHRFCDPLLSAPRRKELLHLLRSLEEESSCQRLQILFSFSVPSPQVLDLLCALHFPLVSAGACHSAGAQEEQVTAAILEFLKIYDKQTLPLGKKGSLNWCRGLSTKGTLPEEGTGYWEYLLQSRGLDVVSFDQNHIFPPEMRYTEILTGGPELLENYPDRALFLAWPDADDLTKYCQNWKGLLSEENGELLRGTDGKVCNLNTTGSRKISRMPGNWYCSEGNNYGSLHIPLTSETSRFSLECLAYFRGHTLFHVGETLGETLSSNPWGQSTSRDFQLALAEDFCCVKRIRLPNWPGHVDSFTMWRRKNPQFVLCDGAHFQYVDTQLEVDQ